MTPSTRTKLIYTTAIFSALLFLLYLPVLIWSPPWGDDGYFVSYPANHITDDSHILLKQGKMLTANRIHPVYINSSTYRNTNINTWSLNGANYVFIRFESDYKILTEYEKTVDGNVVVRSTYIKVTNPFTLWYIEWLDWTAE